MTKQIAVYSSDAKALDLSGIFGSEVDSSVLSTVDGSGDESGVTILRVADEDVAHVEAELEAMDAVASFRTN